MPSHIGSLSVCDVLILQDADGTNEVKHNIAIPGGAGVVGRGGGAGNVGRSFSDSITGRSNDQK